MLSAKLGWHDLTTRPLALMIFAGAFLGFAVKVPLMPFHTWLPAAYAEAPTGTTMLLTGPDVQDGRVWLPAHPAADFPGANALASDAAALADGDHDHLLCERGLCAARPEAHACLFLH